MSFSNPNMGEDHVVRLGVVVIPNPLKYYDLKMIS